MNTSKKKYQYGRSWTYLPRILPYLRPYWKLGFGSVVLTVFSALLALLQPWPLGILVDSVLGSHPLPGILSPLQGVSDVQLLVILVIAGFLLTLSLYGLSVLSEYVNTKLDQRLALDFRSDLFHHAQRMSLSFHDQHRKGDLIGRFLFETRAMGSIPVSLPPIAQGVLTLAGMFWVASRLDMQLALLSLCIIPFVYYSLTYYAVHIEPRVRAVAKMEWRTLGIIMESFTLLRVVLSFGREPYEHRRFRDQAETALDARVTLTVRQALFSLAVNGATAVGTGLVLGFGAYHVLRGHLTVGELLVLMGYIAAVYAPLQSLSGSFSTLQDEVVRLQLACEFLDQQPDIIDLPGAVPLDSVEGRIRFEDVEFHYKTRGHTLRGISFEASPGQTVAIVGRTGAGKSTLLSLLPRLYDAQKGRILIDGRDIREIKLRSLRDHIALVLQEPLLFEGSVADNIRYGRLDASMREITEAARAADIHDFVMSLPEGYATDLGESGVRLSQGERQRIAIARAFLKNAPILLLDEPTSSIDARTEHSILEALHRLSDGRTTLVVAHRLSTIRHADLILVLEHGRIVEMGSHDRLIGQEGMYRELHDLQVTRRPDPASFRSQRSPTKASGPVGAGSSVAGTDRRQRRVGPQGTPTPSASMRWMPKRLVIVLGMMSKMPVAGVVWQTVQYLVGLRQLGYEVLYVEAHARTPGMLMKSAKDDSSAAAAAFIARIMERFDLKDAWAFHALHDNGLYFGLSGDELHKAYKNAALLINLHGGTEPLPEHAATGRLIYLETDPVQLQIELHDNSVEATSFLEPHSAFFTFAENYGRSSCKLPVSERYQFIPTRQPIVLEFWRHDHSGGRVMTTIGNWRQVWREVVYQGETYHWSKDREFLKVIDLPRRVHQPLELALGTLSDADRALLIQNGWSVRGAAEVSRDIDHYRRYITSSRGEFTVAKDQNVRFRTGWFSDRSATYLAAGLPVVTQDTGFGELVPTGSGLFAFDGVDEAVVAIEAINADYENHRRGALDVAIEHFEASRVLSKLLGEVGVTRTQGGLDQAGPREERHEPLPRDLLLTPISRWPTTLPMQTVEAVLSRPLPRTTSVSDAPIGSSIVIVTCGGLAFTRLCLETVLANTAFPGYELIIVDNASADGTADYLESLAKANPQIRLFVNNENRGFPAAVNQGLASARGTVFVILNNDTLVAPGWLAGLTGHLRDNSIGLVGPVTNRAGTEAEIDVPYRTYGEFIDFAADLSDAQPRLRDLRTLTLFCAAMRRVVYERVGPLDEAFGLGLFEDDDYSMRVRKMDLRVACCDNVFVHHFGQATIGSLGPREEYGELFHANRSRFEAKWHTRWTPHPRRSKPWYEAMSRKLRATVEDSVPIGSKILVVSNGDDHLLEFEGRPGRHFPQGSDGGYAGHHPANSEEAIAHLVSLCADGYEVLVIPQSALWWIDHYVEFGAHLANSFETLARLDNVGWILSLRKSGRGAASMDWSSAATHDHWGGKQ